MENKNHSITVAGLGAGDMGQLPLGVYRHLKAKMIRRHPHVFGNVKAESAEEVAQNWERIKAAEKQEKRE